MDLPSWWPTLNIVTMTSNTFTICPMVCPMPSVVELGAYTYFGWMEEP